MFLRFGDVLGVLTVAKKDPGFNGELPLFDGDKPPFKKRKMEVKDLDHYLCYVRVTQVV